MGTKISESSAVHSESRDANELPPSDESDSAALEREQIAPTDADRSHKSFISRILENWGPWSRFARYRAFEREGHDHWTDRDPQANEKGSLPIGESVQVPAIWVAELYAPSQIGGLLEGIAKLGWEHGKSREDSLLKWASDVRQGRSAGWTSLGLVSDPRKPNYACERTAVLPEGVTAALPQLMSLTPSVTALVVAFLLDDKASDELDVPLQAFYSTRSEKSPRLRLIDIISYVLLNKKSSLTFRRTIHDSHSQRGKAVRRLIGNREENCVNWVRNNLPGAFASGVHGRLFPTAVLMVTEVALPVSEETQSIRAFDGLSIGRNYDAWESDQWPNARLVLPLSWGDDSLRCTFACRRRDAFSASGGWHDPTSNWTIAQRADGQITGILSRWGLTCMLDGYHQKLSDLRDRSAAGRSYRTVRDLEQLRSLVRTDLYDISASAHEIQEFVDDEASYRDNVLEMKSVDSFRGTSIKLVPVSLVDVLRHWQRGRAQQILRETTLLQSVLSISSDVSQTISNIRIQVSMVVLTLVSIGLAVFSVMLTIRTMH